MAALRSLLQYWGQSRNDKVAWEFLGKCQRLRQHVVTQVVVLISSCQLCKYILHHLLELLTARNDPSVFPMFLSAFSVAAVRGRRHRTLSHSKSSLTGHTEYMRRWRQRIKEDPTMYRQYLEKQSESGRRHRAKKKTALGGSSTFQLGKS